MFDTAKLIAAVKTKRVRDGLSLRGMSDQIGVSFSSLARFERGDGEPDTESASLMCDWLGLPASDFGVDPKAVALLRRRDLVRTIEILNAEVARIDLQITSTE